MAEKPKFVNVCVWPPSPLLDSIDVIKEYVPRLIAKGKPYKSALVAAMRKLLIHLQSLLKKQKLELV